MGACLSCLGLRRDADDEQTERLLYDDYPQNGHAYGTWGHSSIPPQNVMSPEEVRREQEALDNITRWATDQIVEIFPHHQHRNLLASTSQLPNGGIENDAAGSDTHQDILLSMIPGDKSKRSIRIYPASRPTSKDAQSIRSKASSIRLNGGAKGMAPGVFVKLDVGLP